MRLDCVRERKGCIDHNLTAGLLKISSGLELVSRCEPSICQSWTDDLAAAPSMLLSNAV